MWRLDAQRWRNAREQGMRSWVLRRGVLSWGVPMYGIIGGMQVFQRPRHRLQIALINLPIWLLTGVLFGLSSGWSIALAYKRHLRKAERH